MALKFLIIDFHPESRFLLVRTLQRKFPGAEIAECDEIDPALRLLRRGRIDAIVAHRTFEESGVELVQRFRCFDRQIPIIMVSGIDRAEAAQQAGATCFLHYDEWLRIGSVVEQHLAQRPAASDADSNLVA